MSDLIERLQDYAMDCESDHDASFPSIYREALDQIAALTARVREIKIADRDAASGPVGDEWFRDKVRRILAAKEGE